MPKLSGYLQTFLRKFSVSTVQFYEKNRKISAKSCYRFVTDGPDCFRFEPEKYSGHGPKIQREAPRRGASH